MIFAKNFESRLEAASWKHPAGKERAHLIVGVASRVCRTFSSALKAFLEQVLEWLGPCPPSAIAVQERAVKKPAATQFKVWKHARLPTQIDSRAESTGA